jgi:hypothetical protein
VVKIRDLDVNESVPRKLLTRTPGTILEFPPSAIQVQNRRLFIPQQEDVRKAVLIEIPEYGATSATWIARKTGRCRDLGERAVPVVSIEAAGRPSEIVREYK